MGAEKQGQKIAVEIQSFLGPSPVRNLEEAVGQYEVYRAVLAETEPERVPYLALPRHVREGLLSERFGQVVVARLRLRLLIFDEVRERIMQWIEPSATAES